MTHPMFVAMALSTSVFLPHAPPCGSSAYNAFLCGAPGGCDAPIEPPTFKSHVRCPPSLRPSPFSATLLPLPSVLLPPDRAPVARLCSWTSAAIPPRSASTSSRRASSATTPRSHLRHALSPLPCCHFPPFPATAYALAPLSPTRLPAITYALFPPSPTPLPRYCLPRFSAVTYAPFRTRRAVLLTSEHTLNSPLHNARVTNAVCTETATSCL